MYPDSYLLVERVRAQELRAAAQAHGRARRGTAAATWELRLGWALVEAGLRLVCRGTYEGPRLADRHA
ncbi:hypothetical protein ACIBIZ_02490 [Nonomuraea spiralis]|uniref:Uncharacterized protein n=1 Tax=Nonomuraea spiralis TaxID=46182 RepID=A0ABV5IAM0_9ACTN|nr:MULTISPECIES: hypothetical protein [Nonomuraea]RSN14492.1 hypothetical protein DMB42_08295 [Nonomuraea sp. WAC 01424]GGT03846.1 hypothetical protein GCM10010176_055020 [Nonomuraea spiralis]